MSFQFVTFSFRKLELIQASWAINDWAIKLFTFYGSTVIALSDWLYS